MTLEEAIKARHSVRNYKYQPLSEEVIDILQQKIDECNTLGDLQPPRSYCCQSAEVAPFGRA